MKRELKVLEHVPFSLDRSALRQRLRVEADSEDGRVLDGLLDDVEACARPRAVYREVYVDARDGDTVTLSGVTFSSAALRKNLEGVERAFAFVASCGPEPDGISLPESDFLAPYWLDTLKAELLRAAVAYLKDHLHERYGMKSSSSMSPGSGDVNVWPIEQQASLFSLVGDVEDATGVRLTESFLMVPNKSVSGIRFAAEVDFRTCQLCHRRDCPSRSAAFNQELWDELEHGVDAGQ